LIEKALDEPIGSPPLEELIREKQPRRTCLIVEDQTRPAPVRHVLPRILDRLERCGVAGDKIYIVMALGTHRPMTGAELEAKLGRETLGRVAVYNSAHLEAEGMVSMGRDGDIPLLLDRAKMIIPGVTGRETVAAYHLKIGLFEKNEFGSPMTPGRELMERWAGRIGLDFVVNCIVTAEKKLYRLVSGHFIKAQRRGVLHSREVYGVQAAGRADMVISNSYPAQSDFWQAQKAYNSGEIATRRGGEVLLVAPCPEGIGPHEDLPEMYALARQDAGRLYDLAMEGRVSDPIAASSGLSKAIAVFKDVRAGLVCDTISEEQAEKLGITKYAGLQDAIEARLAVDPKTTFNVITHGGYLLPLLEES
jgi:nickel-dependent lactate racemase